MSRITAKMSEYAEAWIQLDGHPFRLDLYPMHREIYDGRYQLMMVKSARQIGKSTLLGVLMIVEAVLIRHFHSVYISPSQKSMRYFSTSRVGKIIKFSPLLAKKYALPELVNRVEHKQLVNGSEMLFTYASESEDDADRLRGPSSDHNCYDKDAFALTKQGWILVSNLKSTDLVADVNDEGTVEWNPPTRIFSKEYTGPMVKLRHGGFYLRVTGDHKLWLNQRIKTSPRYHQEDKYVFKPALEAVTNPGMGFKLTSKTEWTGGVSKYRIFEGTPTREKRKCEYLKIPYKDFARLVGWYLSEGSVNHHPARTCVRAILSQNVGRGFKDICSTLDRCMLPYSVLRIKKRKKLRRIYIMSETLGQYFKPLGNSYTKYIPREFFESAELLEQVLQGIYLGDASYHKGEQWQCGTLRTRSRRMAEDVQEAWLRLGRPAVIHKRMMAPNPASRKKPLYEVCSYNRDYFIFWRSEFKKKKRVEIEKVKDEKVFCFTVKHHRPIVKGSFNSKPCIGSQCYDEIQDMLYDPIVVVGNEMMAKSRYKFETYTGTPKSMENTIQFLWEQSTQTEWVMKCEACGSYQFIDGEKFIGKIGPVCLKCGGALDPFKGKWVDMVPGKALKGFHISQPCLPENVPYAMRNASLAMRELADRNWKAILRKYETLPISRFRNEVLGVSDAIGARLLSLEDLEALCLPYKMQQVPDNAYLSTATATYAGVDWSGGGTSGVSRTVLWIWGVNQQAQKLRVMFYKVFPGTNPVEVVEEIGAICQSYHVSLTVGDAGEGHLANAELRRILGAHRVIPVQYGSQAQALVYNGVDRYTSNRTTVIDNYLMMLKQGRAEFACREDMQLAISDILSEYEETTILGKKVWRHSPQKPDDCLHAGLYGWLAWKISTADLRFYQ